MQDKNEEVERKKPKRDEKGRYLPGEQGGYVGKKAWIYDEVTLSACADDLIEWVKENVVNKKEFLLKDWCFYYDFPPNHIPRFVKRSARFAEAVEFAKDWQAHMICKGALLKKLDPGFAKFMLACVHQWKDGTDEESAKQELASDFAKFNENMEVLRAQQKGE